MQGHFLACSRLNLDSLPRRPQGKEQIEIILYNLFHINTAIEEGRRRRCDEHGNYQCHTDGLKRDRGYVVQKNKINI